MNFLLWMMKEMLETKVDLNQTVKKVVKKELEGYRELRRTYGKQALSEEFAFFFRNDPLRAELDALPPVKREIKRMTD